MIAAGLQILIGAGKADVAVLGFVDVLDFEGEQAAFLAQEQLGIVGGGHENGLHAFQKFILTVQIRSRNSGPDPVQKFGNVRMGNDRYSDRKSVV